MRCQERGHEAISLNLSTRVYQYDFNIAILNVLLSLSHITATGREQNISWALSSCLKNISDRTGLENDSGGFHSSNNAVQSKTTRPQSLILLGICQL